MFKNLQQNNSRPDNTAAAVVAAGRGVPLIANIALLLALIIISRLNGVVLIA
jgi:hypothetical protein